MSTQKQDGHWTQNQWLDGRAFWTGIQMDETGLPIILAQALKDRNALDGLDVRRWFSVPRPTWPSMGP